MADDRDDDTDGGDIERDNAQLQGEGDDEEDVELIAPGRAPSAASTSGREESASARNDNATRSSRGWLRSRGCTFLFGLACGVLIMLLANAMSSGGKGVNGVETGTLLRGSPSPAAAHVSGSDDSEVAAAESPSASSNFVPSRSSSVAPSPPSSASATVSAQPSSPAPSASASKPPAPSASSSTSLAPSPSPSLQPAAPSPSPSSTPKRVCVRAGERPELPTLTGADYGPPDSLHLYWGAVGDWLADQIVRSLSGTVWNTGVSVPIVVHILIREEQPGEVNELKSKLPRCDALWYRFYDHRVFENYTVFNRIVHDMFGRERVPTDWHANRARIFMMKPFLHQLLPESVGAALVLDSDTRPLTDVRGLLVDELAEMRRSGAVVALAPELQPEYLGVGMGQGFNGGVQLLDLKGMRASAAYNSFLRNITWESTKWPNGVHADLGDQTLYTLLNETQPSLVRTLPCQWNFNTCQYWVKHRQDVSSLYPWVGVHQCPPPVKIYHGNGGTISRWALSPDEELQAMAERFHNGSYILDPDGDGCR